MSDDPNRSEIFDIPAIDPVRVERALRSLPSRERKALLFKSRERLSYAEVGARLGTDRAGAQALVAAALAKLHRLLFGRSPDWPGSRPRD